MKENKILVPIDFSEQSLIALSQACNLAKRIEASVTLLYVIEEINPVVKLFVKGLDEIKDAVTSNLKNLALEKSKETGLTVNTEVDQGRVYNRVVLLAKNSGYRFIVLGTKGTSKLKKYIGSNTLRILKTSPCPVITIKGKPQKQGCKRIVLPLDLTNQTTQKVSEAIQIAKSFNSEIYLVSLILTGDVSVVNKLVSQMIAVKEEIKKQGVSCSAEFVKIIKSEDTIGEGVVAYSKKVDADLIMIMTQKESAVRELFIGASARQIINTSNLPVLSVVPQKL